MGCTTSAPVDEEAYSKQAIPIKQPPAGLNGSNRGSEEIKAHPAKSSRPGEGGSKSEGVNLVSHVTVGRLHASAATDGADTGTPGSTKEKKERRLALDSRGMRAHRTKPDQGGAVDEVAASSDDDDDDPNLPPPSSKRYGRTASMIEAKSPDIVERIQQGLQNSLVFKGIDRGILQQVVLRMFKVEFEAGATVLEQNAPPGKDDCLYFLEEGDVDIVVHGGFAESDQKKADQGNSQVSGQMVFHKGPGWVFGDVALLFNSPRSASIVAKTNLVLYAMDRRVFLKFVMKHAPGARALRFVRKLTPLKGLSDNVLLNVAARMKEETYEDGQALIRYGERGDKLFLIRYGRVRVLRPDDKNPPDGRIEVAKMGRGHFVGERALIAGKLRSADCIAEGQVTVIIMNKKDFLDLDNPMLSSMMDYDITSAVLRACKAFQGLSREQLEEVIDRFEREDLQQGDVVVRAGEVTSKLYVVKMGELSSTDAHGAPAQLQEAGGFSYFGEQSLTGEEASRVTVTIQSETAIVLSLSRRALLQLLGGTATELSSEDAAVAVAALQSSPALHILEEAEIKRLVTAFEAHECQEGEVLAWQGEQTRCMFVVKAGQCMLTTGVTAAQKEQALQQADAEQSRPCVQLKGLSGDKVKAGDYCGDQCLTVGATWAQTLVAVAPGTQVVALELSRAEEALGQLLEPLLQHRANTQQASKQHLMRNNRGPKIEFKDLEMHRIIGTGQFGLVRVVRHIGTNQVYALKVMHKAPIVEVKQVEHVVNERRILEEAIHPFCVNLIRAYQDKSCLYLLQEWVGGGELFHHLDLEGAFDEPTAMFYAANVLLALEHLHEHGIVYRDLKPENLLLDAYGYIKVADFGFAKKIGGEKTYTICGTPDYQAPEVIMRKGTSKAADYWALGVLIFEMLVGDPPFKSMSGDPWDTFRRTLSGRFYVPNFISDSAADLIYKLLQVNPERRLGSGPTGADEIKKHKWFAKLDWEALASKKLQAPIQPKLSKPLDTSNFDTFDNVEPPTPVNRSDKNAHMWDSLWDWIPEQQQQH